MIYKRATLTQQVGRIFVVQVAVVEIFAHGEETILWYHFLESFNADETIQIPKHAYLGKLVDSNINIQSKERRNFCPSCDKVCISLWVSVCNTVAYDFIEKVIIGEKIEEIVRWSNVS